jgi:hypothetical protein
MGMFTLWSILLLFMIPKNLTTVPSGLLNVQIGLNVAANAMLWVAKTLKQKIICPCLPLLVLP